MHLMKPFDHRPLASLHGLHVDAQRFGFEAKFRASPGKRDDLGGIDDVLARETGDARTRSRDILPLDDRHPELADVDIYQVWQTPFAADALPTLTAHCIAEGRRLFAAR